MKTEAKCHKFWETGLNPITMKKDERPEDYIITRKAVNLRKGRRNVHNEINE